jgi:hypothetical protein
MWPVSCLSQQKGPKLVDRPGTQSSWYAPNVHMFQDPGQHSFQVLNLTLYLSCTGIKDRELLDFGITLTVWTLAEAYCCIAYYYYARLQVMPISSAKLVTDLQLQHGCLSREIKKGLFCGFSIAFLDLIKYLKEPDTGGNVSKGDL